MMDKKNIIINNPALAMVTRVQNQQAGLGIQNVGAGKDGNVEPGDKEKDGKTEKQELKGNVKQKDKQNDKQKTKSEGCYLRKQAKNFKDVTMTIRTNSDVKEDFDSVRQFYGYSQSDFLAALMVFAKEQAVKDGWKS